LTPADEFIWNHLPEKAEDQFLKTPLKLDQYEQTILFTPEFFDYHLELVSPMEPISTCETSMEIKIKDPQKAPMMASVTFNG